tara:strand:+ start:857 stop:1780 length:924 start_codon:yes stop_codon:yes gene_type:complete
MKKHNYYFFLVFFIFQIQYLFAFENKIIVTVEKEFISSYELKNKIRTLLVLSGQEINQENINNIKKISLNQLIDLKLKKKELKKYNFQEDKKSLSEQLNRISKNNIYDFKKKFTNNDLNYELFLEELETEIDWQKLIYILYNKRIKIGEEEIEQDMKKILSDKQGIEKFRLSEIEILIVDKNQMENDINLVNNEIRINGFESAVRKFSISQSSTNNGDIGWINKNALSKNILKKISTLKIGEVSPAIKKANSVVFLKMVDKKKSQIKFSNLEKIKSDLITRKKNEILQLYSNSHFSKIKNNSLIEYK